MKQVRQVHHFLSVVFSFFKVFNWRTIALQSLILLVACFPQRK